MKAKEDGMNVLHAASSFNDVHLLDYVLRVQRETKGSKTAVQSQDSNGMTPAHYAGLLGSFDSMNLLLEHGADLTQSNN